MPLFPEVSGTQPQQDTWLLQAPWMHTTIDGFPPGREPTLVGDLYRFDKVKRLPCWFHPPRASQEIRQDSQTRPYDEPALVDFFARGRAVLNEDFSWPLEEILSRSFCADVEGIYDPLALFGAMQRLILIDSMALQELGEQVRTVLESADDLQNKKLLQDLVQVSYHVTRYVPRQIKQSINFGGAAETRLQSFLLEEENHDVFALKSLLLLTAV